MLHRGGGGGTRESVKYYLIGESCGNYVCLLGQKLEGRTVGKETLGAAIQEKKNREGLSTPAVSSKEELKHAL